MVINCGPHFVAGLLPRRTDLVARIDLLNSMGQHPQCGKMGGANFQQLTSKH